MGTVFRPDLYPAADKRLRLEEEFFATPFLMSYSGLSRLLYSPALFYQHYVLRQQDDAPSKYADEGKLIHSLLLQPGELESGFVVSPEKVPSDNPRRLLDRIFALYRQTLSMDPETAAGLTGLDAWEGYLLEQLREMNLYQSLKTDAQRLEKVTGPECREYWAYLHRAQGRTVVDQDTYAGCQRIVERFRDKPGLMELMGLRADPLRGLEHRNEQELVSFPAELPFGLRGIVDNVCVDHDQREIRVNDLKKSGKDLASFRESIDHFQYWLQAALYHDLVDGHYRQARPELSGYRITFRFVVIDAYLQMAAVRVSEPTMEAWRRRAQAELEKAAFHFRRRSFELPYDFLISNELVL